MDTKVVSPLNGAGAMARYKPYDLNQAKMIPRCQQPATFLHVGCSALACQTFECPVSALPFAVGCLCVIAPCKSWFPG
jgi:hypothetical protein